MKKLLALALVLCMLLAVVPVGASAYSVVLSPQHLKVDGVEYQCEKYNIDGSNYFKLRDLAMLLAGTPAEFAVGWEPEYGAVTIAPGLPYEPIGGELEIGADKSASAVPSAQAFWFLDAPAGISAYNIGDNNFLKLRDLGDLLGFSVDFDAETNTALVYSGADMNRVDPQPGQADAFDAIWDWVEANANDNLGGDPEYYFFHDFGNGDQGLAELIAADLLVERDLLLRSTYFFSNGAHDVTWIFLERDNGAFYASYDYYTADNDGEEPDFTGDWLLIPGEFDASAPLMFDSVTDNLSGAVSTSTLIGFATQGAADILLWLNKICAAEPDLTNRVSIADFGFDPAKLQLSEQ